jgi:hypothetical protein
LGALGKQFFEVLEVRIALGEKSLLCCAMQLMR